MMLYNILRFCCLLPHFKNLFCKENIKNRRYKALFTKMCIVQYCLNFVKHRYMSDPLCPRARRARSPWASSSPPSWSPSCSALSSSAATPPPPSPPWPPPPSSTWAATSPRRSAGTRPPSVLSRDRWIVWVQSSHQIFFTALNIFIGQLVLLAFILLEVALGVYFPAVATLRSAALPESHRSVISSSNHSYTIYWQIANVNHNNNVLYI